MPWFFFLTLNHIKERMIFKFFFKSLNIRIRVNNFLDYDNGALLWLVAVPVAWKSINFLVKNLFLITAFTSMFQSGTMILDLWLTSWGHCKMGGTELKTVS